MMYRKWCAACTLSFWLYHTCVARYMVELKLQRYSTSFTQAGFASAASWCTRTTNNYEENMQMGPQQGPSKAQAAAFTCSCCEGHWPGRECCRLALTHSCVPSRGARARPSIMHIDAAW